MAWVKVGVTKPSYFGDQATDGSIRLSPKERKALLEWRKTAATHEQRWRAHVLLLADGWAWATIISVLYTSSSTINRWRQRFLEGGWATVSATPKRRLSRWGRLWIGVVFRWVMTLTPMDFGFIRSRWTCGTVVMLLKEDHGVRVGRATVRRWLHQKDLVYHRPRPVLGPKDPQRSYKLRKIRALRRQLPTSAIAVFEEEVDLNTNPKIGSMWMRRGQQAEVVTPGTNTRRYLAGSLNWRTGELILTAGDKRHADRRRLRPHPSSAPGPCRHSCG